MAVTYKIFKPYSLDKFRIDILNNSKFVEAIFDRVENIMGNRENAAYQHFLLF